MSSEVAVARWTAGELARLVGADLEGEGGVGFDAVTTDSRESRPGAAFFALDGTRVRGMQFAGTAFGSGCPVVVVPADWTGEVPAGRAAVRCADPLAALAALAVSVRETWTCPVIAVTGSNGKTTVKEMTAHLFSADRAVLRSTGNLNTVVGLARTLLDAKGPPATAVLEVGASLPGEIARLAGMVRPTGACVTNVGPAHLEGFGSVRAVAREKLSLLRAVPPGGVRVVDGDDPAIAAEAGNLETVRCGLGAGNDLRAIDVRPDDRGTTFRIENGPEVRVPVPGPHHVRNALLAIALGRAHGVDPAQGAERLRSFAGVPGRMSTFEAGGVLVIDDAYNANPASMRAALDWLAGLRRPGRRVLALGDMLELGAGSREFHREVGRRVAEMDPALVVFVGEEMRAGFEEASGRSTDDERFRHVADSDEAARLLADEVEPGDAVLVKGSRGVRMERVVEALRKRGDRRAV